ncbi:MAG: hypothetical protein HKM07_07945 [Chlamydiae bacterium]|nr:hypothetical protein [Chlamydiota bacterium]
MMQVSKFQTPRIQAIAGAKQTLLRNEQLHKIAVTAKISKKKEKEIYQGRRMDWKENCM